MLISIPLLVLLHLFSHFALFVFFGIRSEIDLDSARNPCCVNCNHDYLQSVYMLPIRYRRKKNYHFNYCQCCNIFLSFFSTQLFNRQHNGVEYNCQTIHSGQEHQNAHISFLRTIPILIVLFFLLGSFSFDADVAVVADLFPIIQHRKANWTRSEIKREKGKKQRTSNIISIVINKFVHRLKHINFLICCAWKREKLWTLVRRTHSNLSFNLIGSNMRPRNKYLCWLFSFCCFFFSFHKIFRTKGCSIKRMIIIYF